MIIYHLTKTCWLYLISYGNRRPDIYPKCLRCGNDKLHKHGYYHRKVYTKYLVFIIPIYRWYCPKCKKTIAVLPHFLIPYARFYTPLRESVIKRKMQGQSYARIAKKVVSLKNGGLSRQTVKRWWKRFLEKVSQVSLWLNGELIKAGENEDLLRLHSSGVNPQLSNTVRWFFTLAHRYRRMFTEITLWGIFLLLNTRLPYAYHI